VAVGVSDKMAHSTDGANWTVVSNSTFGSNPIRAIAYGCGKFLAGGGDKTAYSTDGINWTGLGTPLGTDALYAEAARRGLAAKWRYTPVRLQERYAS
jgi:hypothetical protein